MFFQETAVQSPTIIGESSEPYSKYILVDLIPNILLLIALARLLLPGFLRGKLLTLEFQGSRLIHRSI